MQVLQLIFLKKARKLKYILNFRGAEHTATIVNFSGNTKSHFWNQDFIQVCKYSQLYLAAGSVLLKEINF